MSKKIFLLMKLLFFIFISFSSFVHAEKIRDLTSIQGIRDNQLIGYGLIVGLNGTGDQSTQIPFTNQSLNNMLSQLGISIPKNSRMNLKNVAAVVVTANLPPFSHTGEQIDVVVSSMGNAKSLKGGMLLMTPLKGTDNQIYAIAQGNIFISENSDQNNKIRRMRINQVNSGKIHNGATIEREIHTDFGKQKTINLQLNQENFSTAQRISDMINIRYPDTATPIDAKTVQLSTVPNNDIQVHMLSRIQDIDITLPAQEAKVVVNTHTGSIVINQSVKLGACVVSNGNMSIIIDKMYDDENRDLNFFESVDTENDNYQMDETNQNYFDNLDYDRDNLNNIVNSLNAIGTKTDELTSLLQLMKSAGCLNAKLEII
ncbi:flagellar basal body P-ring protein FlgI [Buchnera aphidicola (Macrosiphoniella sanborni)]|uniref:Flagellar P-ring protein n=1 Tax=Buchnera aphidicola (Macrosiphoniella sanborni) TaxID=1241865 RepID=A0A4D6Y3N5_9GAMM|nr:flagellar basal body P-ring protein FlgI [Buchnera aphidicola]QCI23877.1 flagellar basal body P-ring protein FlgI [Buchnera aphidicola (Macrosiphoniella sanborni)]